MEMETAFITPMTRWGNIGNIGNMRDMGVQEDKSSKTARWRFSLMFLKRLSIR